MPPLPEKPLAFTKGEIDDLTSRWSDAEIASRLGIAYSAVRKARIAHGIQTFTQKTGLVKIRETGELRPKGSVRGVVRSDGLDDRYFEKIDSPEKAYWLGLLVADGWVSSRAGVPKEVGLALQLQDREVVEGFKAATGYSGRVTQSTHYNSLSRSGMNTLATLRVTCQAFARHAMEAGLQERKSGRLVMPPAAYEFSADFCRGYFDGNGSIAEGQFAFICGSSDFQRDLRALIAVETGCVLRPSASCSPISGKPVERLTGCKRDKAVLDWIYKGKVPCMPRKLSKYQRCWN